jgi:transposase
MKERRSLMHDRFLLLKRATDLTAMEQMVVETWTKHLPSLGQAYQAKEAFFAVYDTTARREAECRYRAWRDTLPTSLHVAFSPLTTALHNWHGPIFAYFDHPITNAYTESVKSKFVCKSVPLGGRR